MSDERRAWTARERDRLLARKPGETLEDLALILGRSYRSVCAAVVRYRVPRRKGWRLLAGREAKLRRLYAKGHGDRAIASKLGVSQATVCKMRHDLGLPANGRTRGAAYLASQKRAVARGLRGLGVSCLGEVRLIGSRAESARRGWWPHALTPRQCDVLDALEAGPLSSRELHRRLGRPDYDGGKKRPLALVIRALARAGSIVGVRRGMGKVWSLAGGVRRREPDSKRTFLNLPRREDS